MRKKIAGRPDGRLKLFVFKLFNPGARPGPPATAVIFEAASKAGLFFDRAARCHVTRQASGKDA